MLTINLLPPQEKESLRMIKTNRLLFSYGLAGFFLLLVFCSLLVSTLIFLNIQVKGMEKMTLNEEKNSSTVALKNMEADIVSTNKKLAVIDKVQSEKKIFSTILEDLASLAPDGVQFYNLSYDGATSRATLDGHALDRQNFISFKDALANDPRFGEIDSPLSNLIKSTDNDFRISFLVK